MTDYHLKRAYRIEIDGITRARFSTCSELSVEMGMAEYREGGNPLPHKQYNGKITYPNVTLTRGIAEGDREFEKWALEAYDPVSGRVAKTSGTKRNLSIIQEDTDGTTLKRWNLIDAFPIKWVASEGWDAGADDDFTMESIELAFQSFS